MTKSRVSNICAFLEGTQHIKDPLALYHRAREIRDATSLRGSQSMEKRLARVKKALKNHAIMASLKTFPGKGDRIRLFRPDRQEELFL